MKLVKGSYSDRIFQATPGSSGTRFIEPIVTITINGENKNVNNRLMSIYYGARSIQIALQFVTHTLMPASSEYIRLVTPQSRVILITEKKQTIKREKLKFIPFIKRKSE